MCVLFIIIIIIIIIIIMSWLSSEALIQKFFAPYSCSSPLDMMKSWIQ